MSRRPGWLLALATLLAAGIAVPVAALTPAEKCARTKLRTAAQYAGCRSKVRAFALKIDTEPDFAFCESRFTTSWQRAELHGGGACPTTGDELAVRIAVAAEVDGLAGAIASDAPGALLPATGQTACYDAAGAAIPCAGTGQDGELQHGAPAQFVDNGDGTISDLRSGLMWEKLADDGGLHDVHTNYTWNTAFGDKVVAANDQAFAGYTDWRLPKVLELQGLVNYGAGTPAVEPIFNTNCVPGCTVLTCSCTASEFYWSTTPVVTSFGISTGLAWLVRFTEGLTFYQQEANPYRARLVRGQ